MNCVWNPFNSVLVTQQQFYTHEQLGIYIWYIYFFSLGVGGGGECPYMYFPTSPLWEPHWDPFPLKFSKMEPYIYMYVVEWKYASHAVFELSQLFCFCFFFDGLNHFTVVGPNQSSDEEENSSSDDDEINDKVHSCIYM